MKSIKFYLSFVVVLSLMVFKTIEVRADEAQYVEVMTNVVERIVSAQSVDDLIKSKGELERISSVYPEKWQPVYYLAYADIQIFFYNPGAPNGLTYLEDAEKQLKRLDAFKLKKVDNVDKIKSEILTLWGYYYNALVVVNPQMNGQKYYSEVLGSYEKAMKLNTENPRAIVLTVMYEAYMPSFYKSPRNKEEEITKAEKIFSEQIKGVDMPYWGEWVLNHIKK